MCGHGEGVCGGGCGADRRNRRFMPQVRKAHDHLDHPPPCFALLSEAILEGQRQAFAGVRRYGLTFPASAARSATTESRCGRIGASGALRSVR